MGPERSHLGGPLSAVAAVGLGLCLLAAAALALPQRAGAVRQIQTGASYSDPLWGSEDPDVRALWGDRLAYIGGTWGRLLMRWRDLTTGVPADPRDPDDPAYDFSRYDRAVQTLRSRGIRVMITVYSAPDYAVGPNSPPSDEGCSVIASTKDCVRPGTWKPDVAAFGDFAHAVATRYSGSFVPTGEVTPLPRVTHLQAWNEGNLSTHLSPQYENGRQFSVGHYRRMLNEFYNEVKAVQPSDVVVSAGTAPYGNNPGGVRTRPVTWLRQLLCVSAGRRPHRTYCPVRTKADIVSHHPTNTSGGPGRRAINRNDASTPDLWKIRNVLRAAERLKTIKPGGHRPLWASEYWWETNPPDPVEGVPPLRQARWIQRAIYLFWRQGASAAIYFAMRDSEYDPENPYLDSSTGLYYYNGFPKPSSRAFRFPIAVDRRGRRWLRFWGKSPVAGRVLIQQRTRGGWRTVALRRVAKGRVFVAPLRRNRKRRGRYWLRARIRANTALPVSSR